MVIVSCITKFHAFALAEQLSKHQHLTGLYTSYSFKKNTVFRNFTNRIDKEEIPIELVHTNIGIAAGLKLISNNFFWSTVFDKWVAAQLQRRDDYEIFIGWSSMSLRSILSAKSAGKITIVERGSSHILYQEKILKQEYELRKQVFRIDPRIIEMELKEYEAADYISIPSKFVRDSFLQYGVPSHKLIQNPYGVSAYFKPLESLANKQKFRILYLGTLSIRKGLLYLFEALKNLNIPLNHFEVIFIGAIDQSLKPFMIDMPTNWKFLGHINHYELTKNMVGCDVAVHASLEEGMSTVILQLLASGIPVIATQNTGAADIIEHNVNGYIIQSHSAKEIENALMYLYQQPELLSEMKKNTVIAIDRGFTWDDYGKRYVNMIKRVLKNKA